ncbi:hypothetical protein TRVL_06140 [Trypanosoma vivax]|nr:hypothetical protein TRVL_06140 [Trypanosoma vivax]
MHLAFSYGDRRRDTFSSSRDASHLCTEMIEHRAEPLQIKVIVGDPSQNDAERCSLCGVVVQTADAKSASHDFTELFERARENGCLACCATDFMASVIVKPPGEMEAFIFGASTQRFGGALAYGGSHAAFFSTRESLNRMVSGRILGVSRESAGDPAI